MTRLALIVSLVLVACDSGPPPAYSLEIDYFPSTDPIRVTTMCYESSEGEVGRPLAAADQLGPWLFNSQSGDDTPMNVRVVDVTAQQGSALTFGATHLERSYDMAFGDAAGTDAFEVTIDGTVWHFDVVGMPGACPGE